MAIIATSKEEAILTDTKELVTMLMQSNHSDDDKQYYLNWINEGMSEADAEVLYRTLFLNQRSLADIAVPSQKEIKEMVKEIVNRENT